MVRSQRSFRRTNPVLLAVLMLVGLAIPVDVVALRGGQTTTIQILDISDWHAQLDPLPGGIGGAAALSTWFRRDRAANPNTITLTGGDDFGASPPLSAFFNEDPAILAQRLMGIQVGTLGNHNFDRGVGHLEQMVRLARLTDDSRKSRASASPMTWRRRPGIG